MVKKIELTLDSEKGNVFVDTKVLDYEFLHSIAIDVIDNENTLELSFTNFENVPDLKVYYEDIFKSIEALSSDAEINELKQKAVNLVSE